MKKSFAKCSCCQKDLFTDKVSWLPKVLIFNTTYLKLFNCMDCKSTGSVKVIVENLQPESQASSLYDRKAG